MNSNLLKKLHMLVKTKPFKNTFRHLINSYGISLTLAFERNINFCKEFKLQTVEVHCQIFTIKDISFFLTR